MNKQIKDLYRLILKHNWRVEKVERIPIYYHTQISHLINMCLISPNSMADRDFVFWLSK